jgi:L-ascorbate metabolism protein UlaG (beta-lactamase superfamily)
VLARGMQITKYEHAAFVADIDGHKLIVDPGGLSRPLGDVTGVDVVVVTHEHADHWTPAQLSAILAANPDAVLYGPAGLAAAASDFPVITVNPGETVTAGPFTLRFFGGTHAEIHRSIPLIDNVGVLINDAVYYPGDSFAVPVGVDVDVLATPAGAPWLKVGEVMDFVTEVAPKRTFPTHEGTLSAAGLGLTNDRITDSVAPSGTHFPLKPGETLEV